LLPSGLRARAEVNRWLLFSATELEQPLWRIAPHTSVYPPEKRLAAEIPIARQDFLEMAAVLEKHMDGRQYLRDLNSRPTVYKSSGDFRHPCKSLI
jgi:glutathione S-transferase